MKKPLNHFRSICFPEEKDLLNHPGDVGKDTRTAFLDEYHRELEKCSPRETWAGDAHLRAVPYPVLCNKAHQRQLAELSEALVLAVTDIVERWWSDSEARFPERMPLQPVEEKLLRVSPGLEYFERINSQILVDARFGTGVITSIRHLPRDLATRLST